MSYSEIYCAFRDFSLKSEENELSVHEAKVGDSIQYKILSQFETRMDCSHPESEVFKIHKSESSIFDHLSKFLLRWKLPYALHQVLIGVPVPSEHLAHRWDDLEGIKVIQGVHSRSCYFAELQTHEPSSWF